MSDLWTARLSSQSSRYQDWYEILGDDVVPLESAWTYTANLGAEKDVTIYKLDVARLKPGQRDRLVAWIMKRFAGVTREDVERELDSVGFPIREVDVIVTFSMRAFL